jgi:RNA polymerase sigma-70 factor (ECF subfamily)
MDGSLQDADANQPTPLQAVALEGAKAGRMSGLKFRLIVLQHQRSVYGLARSLLKDNHEAEDATQEAFERLWRHGGGVERPKEWLMTVVRNACLDRLRKAGRIVSEADGHMPEPRDDRDPSWHFDQGELASRLNGAIEALPEPQRSLVILFDVQGMSGAECARILELSGEQVKVYLHRARRRLRTRLEQVV